MYRYNIFHILLPVACLIGLFVVYQAWLKPTYFPTPPPGQLDAVVEGAQDAPPEPRRDGPQELELKQTRLIDPSVVPKTTHHELLETIRDEIEKGNIQTAETKLADLPASIADDNITRPYLSILWNNLGIQQEKHGGTVVSIKAFKKAASLDAKNPVILLNLAHAYWELRDPAMTQEFLEQLVTLAPNEPFPHLALADLFQGRDQLGEAAQHLDHATARTGKDPAMQSYLRTVTAKVRGTEKSEARLTSRDSAHFTVKFDGEADQTTWTAVLETIRDEIEKGNIKTAETKLANLPASIADDNITRPYLSILWNNLGIQQEKHGGTVVSIKAFKKAVSLDAKNPVILLNLAHAYWELRDPAMTQEFLEQLVTLAPNEPFPHLALADLFQGRDQLGEAARHLDLATARTGKDLAMQSYLRTVTAKVRGTEKSEARLTSRDSAHFTVKFDGEADQTTWTAVLEILEEAYREIGQKFGHFPSKTIVVVLHAKSTFQSATGSPLWADGLFDPVLGRIQVPTQGALTDPVWLTRVLRHEFVHALLHDQLGQAGSAVPTWLNEGLAMELSGDRWSDLDQIMKQEFTLIPLPALEGAWGGLSGDAATVAYLEANSAVHYLVDRFGMHRVQDLLAHLKAKQGLSAAMQSQLSLSYEQFQSRWVDQLQQHGKKG